MADGLIVVAALAVTFALARMTIPEFLAYRTAISKWTTLPQTNPAITFVYLKEARTHAQRLGYLFPLIALTWLYAFALIRLRRPRPSFLVISFQPGMAAFYSASSAYIVKLLAFYISYFDDGISANGRSMWIVMFLTVPVCWGVLKLLNRWKTGDTWIDRFGLGAGLLWCMLAWSVPRP